MTVDAGPALAAVRKALEGLRDVPAQPGRRRPWSVVNFDGSDAVSVAQLAAANSKAELVAAVWAVQHKAEVSSELFQSAVRYIDQHKTLRRGPESNSDGICLCFTFDDDARMQLAQEGGEPWQDLHVTLGYFGDLDDSKDKARFVTLAMAIATEYGPFDIDLNGIARFSGDDRDAFVVNADAPILPDIYSRMRHQARSLGIDYTPNHGYSPHMTLGYLDHGAPVPLHRWAPVTVTATAIELWWGKQRTPFALGHDYRDAIQENQETKDVFTGPGSVPLRFHLGGGRRKRRCRDIIERAHRLSLRKVRI